MHILCWATMVPQQSQLFSLNRIIARNCSSVATGPQVLGGVEAKAGQTARTAYGNTPSLAPMRLCGILDDCQPMRVRKFLQSGHVHGPPVQVDRDNGPGSRCREVHNRVEFQMEGIGIDISKDRCCTYVANSLGGGKKSVGRHDHFI